MNKTTLMLVATVGILGAATWFMTRPPEVREAAPLKIAGYATAEQLAAEKNKGMLDAGPEIAHPVDEIVVERQGERLRFVRQGEGKALTWQMVEPRQALAVKWSVDKMVTAFKDETSSIYAKKVKAEDLPLFDLEPERRIAVTLKSQGAVWNGVDLIVGKVESSETEAADGGMAKDTWVMAKGDEATVYRVAGKDLREPFEAEVDDLRDKKVFGSLAAEDLVRVTVTAPSGERLVLAGDRVEAPSAQTGDAAEAGAAPAKPEVTWRIEAPAGVEADSSAGHLARNLASLRTRKFAPPSEAPPGAFEGPLWKVEGRTHDGQAVAVEVTDGRGDEVWARVVGADEVLQLDEYAADTLRKTVADVRDRRLTPTTSEAVTRVRFSPEGGGAVVVERAGDGWRFVEPAATFQADVASVLTSVVDAKATRHARADEAEAARAATAQPEFTAELTAGGQAWALAFGPKMEAEGYRGERWAAVGPVGGEPTAWVLVNDYAATRYRKAVDDLRSKKVFGFGADAIDRLEVAWPGGEVKVTLARAEAGQPLALLDVPEGKQPKAAAVTSLGSTLPNLRAKAFGDTKKPAEVGLSAADAYRVTATLSDGAKHVLLVSKVTEGSDPWATAETGPLAGQVFTLNNYQVMNLLKEPGDLLE